VDQPPLAFKSAGLILWEQILGSSRSRTSLLLHRIGLSPFIEGKKKRMWDALLRGQHRSRARG